MIWAMSSGFMKTEVEICLSLGSNLGDRLQNLQNARRLLSVLPSTYLEDSSSIYETEPVGVENIYFDLRFLNAAIAVRTELEIHAFAAMTKQIEAELGRRKEPRPNLPRVVDIDIICAGSLSLVSKELVVPHPRWSQRRFVVEPLAEIRPDLLIPGSDLTVIEVLKKMPQKPSVSRVDLTW